MINQIPESVPESKEIPDGKSEIHAARLRFESMSAFSREAWIERARKLLPPSCHNDPDAVLFAALELVLHEKAVKGSNARSPLLFIILFCLLCSLPLPADAFWPFSRSVKKTPPAQEVRHLIIHQSMYQGNYGDYVHESPADVYVISADSPQPTSFHRALREIPVAINLGSNPETVKMKVAASNSPLQSSLSPAVEHQKEKEEVIVPDPKCVDKTVYFDIDSALVKEQEKKQLLEHMNELNQSRVSVIGYTCDLGSRKYNDKLAMNRAEHVAALLRDRGVIPADVKGMGKCCYVSGDRAKNRRVEIICDRVQNK